MLCVSLAGFFKEEKKKEKGKKELLLRPEQQEPEETIPARENLVACQEGARLRFSLGTAIMRQQQYKYIPGQEGAAVGPHLGLPHTPRPVGWGSGWW